MNLQSLNSLTQYPSIPTYHAIGDKGRLVDEEVRHFGDDEAVYVTEKIDGTNARIIVMPDGDWFIGSRTELLAARGDRVWNPAMGIVDAVRDIAEVAGRLHPLVTPAPGRGYVIFGEVYGGKVTAASKLYAPGGSVGFRVFDVMRIPTAKLSEPPEAIARWRQAGGQEFLSVGALHAIELKDRIVCYLKRIDGSEMPRSLSEAANFLRAVAPQSFARLEPGEAARPEGVVVRNTDRSKIFKLRYEDYDRTLRRPAR